MSKKNNQEKWQKKINKDLFSQVQSPYSLNDILGKMTKADLDEIRRTLGLKGVSGYKKAELIEVLKENIVENMSYLLSSLDYRQLKFLEELCEKQTLPISQPIDLNPIYFYRFSGLVFTGSIDDVKTFIMPTEIGTALKELITDDLLIAAGKYDEWIKITQGLLYYYGVLDTDQLKTFITKYAKNPVFDFELYENVIDTASIIYEQYYATETGYACCAVIEPDKIVASMDTKKLPFYNFSYKDLMKAGEIDYIDRNYHYKKFTNFILAHYHIAEDMVDDIVTTCIYDINNMFSKDDIFNDLCHHLQLNRMDLVQGAADHLQSLTDHTRQWSLKGHTMHEVEKKTATTKPSFPFAAPLANGPVVSPLVSAQPVSSQPAKKVGRNSPCPCGTGKKYKFCCGRG